MRRKLLIIGAGINQLPIIRTAVSLGYHVTVVTPQGDYPGIAVADEVFYEDIFNKDSILSYAVSNGIEGVISDQSDIIAPTVAYVAEKMGLPGFGYHNALCFTNKSLMREVYRETGLPIAPNKKTDTYEEALSAAGEIGYPLVIKPEDSFSSRGVLAVFSPEDLSSRYPLAKKESRSGRVIVEKLIEGPQYFCQGFVDEYKLDLYAFSDRYYFDLPNHFLPYTNAFPAKISKDLERRMTEDFNRVIDHLKPRFGHVWAEWIYDDKADVLYMIEMAIRGAGAFVTTDVIPRAYGVDSQPYLVKAAMGESPVHFSELKKENRAAAFYCFLLPEGTVKSVRGIKELEDIPGVVKTNLRPVNPGDVIPPVKDKSSRFGPIIVEGKDRDELDTIREKMKNTLKIEVETINGTEGAIWE